MRVAIVGSRSITVTRLGDYLPEDTTVIISGGAHGVDFAAKKYAVEHHMELIEFLPDYRRYGRGAPLRRNLQIIESADCVIAFWDGESRGTAFVIRKCKEKGVPCQVYMQTE